MNNIINGIKLLIKKTESQKELYNNFDQYNARITALNHVLELANWQNLSDLDKQVQRIIKVALYRKEEWNVSEYLKKIELYELYYTSLPYINAINNDGNLDNLIAFCNHEIQVINITNGDSADYATIEDVNEAFLPFFNISLKFINSNFEECYNRIIILNTELKKLYSKPIENMK